MIRSEGSVVKRPRGGWQIRYYVRGREIRESVAKLVGKRPHKCTEDDAKRALQARLNYYQNGRMAPSVGHSPHEWLVAQAVSGVINPIPVIIRAEELRVLTGPIVYAYFRAGRALYVGVENYRQKIPRSQQEFPGERRGP